ncbi:MAG: LysM peptidoglycan-binding domain-containing protein [Bacteroidia bacterium]|nr:LysM peptidoglycan-binding domain-containing protein [Bacteroidia bacterium]
MKLYILTVIYVFFVAFQSRAEAYPDSLDVSADSVQPVIPDTSVIKPFCFSQNIDSLVLLWYVRNSCSVYENDSIIEQDSIIPEFPDSILEQRLKAIPSFIQLPFNDKVKAFINVYTKLKREKAEYMLGVAEYYFPIFEQVLDYYGLPLELKYLPVIESALYSRAVSRAGAVGLWQFMYTTGKLYNLEINSYVDERLDPVASSYAAARYLSDLYDIYGDWILSLAAYNCGPGNVNKAIRRSKGKTTYWELYHHLPRETRGYVPAFIAAVYFMNYYKEHNLIPKTIDLYLYDTVMVKQQLHLQQVAEVLNLPVDMLSDLNPQYRKNIIPERACPYPLRLPFEYTTKFIDLADSIYNYKDSVFFAEKSAIIPEKTSKTSQYLPEPPSSDMVKLVYTVKSGDNLGYIAGWYNVRASEIKYWNNIRRNLIREGQKLVIYKPKRAADKYANIDSMGFEEKQRMIGLSSATAQNDAVSEVNEDDGYIYYTVKAGDNLWSIAKKFPGVSDTDIKKLNNISDAKSIAPGQKLKIMKK